MADGSPSRRRVNAWLRNGHGAVLAGSGWHWFRRAVGRKQWTDLSPRRSCLTRQASSLWCTVTTRAPIRTTTFRSFDWRTGGRSDGHCWRRPSKRHTRQVSPNGRWLAYVSDESGNEEIYVRSFPDIDAGGRWQVSTGGGTQPLWARNGRELLYRNGEAVIAVLSRPIQASWRESPEVLFEG